MLKRISWGITNRIASKDPMVRQRRIRDQICMADFGYIVTLWTIADRDRTTSYIRCWHAVTNNDTWLHDIQHTSTSWRSHMHSSKRHSIPQSEFNVPPVALNPTTNTFHTILVLIIASTSRGASYHMKRDTKDSHPKHVHIKPRVLRVQHNMLPLSIAIYSSCT